MHKLATLLLILGTPAVASELSVTVATQEIVVRGATPGASVIGFGISREALGFESRIVRHDRVTQADSRGKATFVFEEPLALRTLWTAVDPTTGKYGIGAPPGFPTEQLYDDKNRPVLRTGRKHNRSIDVDLSFAELLYVSRAGAWAISLGDGSPGDDDAKANSVIRTTLDAVSPLHGSPGRPLRLTAGDVLILIHPNTLQYLATMLAGEVR